MVSLFSLYPKLKICESDISFAYDILLSVYKNKGKVLVCGNGGSAADSEHIVGELMKGFMKKRPLSSAEIELLRSVSNHHGNHISENLQGTLPAISLVSQTALMTAFSNDVAPDMVFAQQVWGYGEKNDVLIGLSTSGNSKNVVYAAITAKAKGMKVIAFTGESGGELKNVADVTIKVPSNNTPEIQEYHLPIYHKLCEMLEEEFFNE